jgi:hypothetical protein
MLWLPDALVQLVLVFADAMALGIALLENFAIQQLHNLNVSTVSQIYIVMDQLLLLFA